MINKLKILSALQWARQRGTVVILCMVCSLLFMPAGCGSKSSIFDGDEGVDENQTPLEDENSLTEDELYDGTDFFYTNAGNKEYFKIRKDKVIIKTKSAEDAKVLCQQNIFRLAECVSGIWVLATIDPRQIKLDDLLQREDIIDATYGLEYREGTLQYPKDQIFIKPKDGQAVENILEKNGLRGNVVEIELFNPLSELYIVTLNVKLADILQVCRIMYESNLCFADPSFFLHIKIRP